MPISFRGALLFSALLLVIVFFMGFGASAQTFGTIHVTVTDPSSAVIPGATVVLSGTWAVNRAQEAGCTYCSGGDG